MNGPRAVTAFANHRAVEPLLWVLAALALLELGLVHLFVALKWPHAAWPLTAASALGVVALVRGIVSWRRCPHELDDRELRLRIGSLRTIAVPLASIASVEPISDSRSVKAPGVRSLVPLAMPNRLVRLASPLPDRRGTTALAVRVDDPAAFDAAFASLACG